MTSEEDDWQGRAEFTQPGLQCRTVQSGYLHVQENAARDTFARQSLQQVLSRSVGRDLVTGALQTAFYRCPEGRIVVDNMYKPRQQTLHAASHYPVRGWLCTDQASAPGAKNLGASEPCSLPPRFACEAFAQEPIHYQLGLSLTSSWCGVHDCAGQPFLLARHPVENVGRDWRVVAVAVDRGAIRHDLFPKRSGLLRSPGSKVHHASERTSHVRRLSVSEEIERYTWV